MRIPVRNLYLLLSYAWDTLDLIDLVEVGVEDSPEPRDLLARVLVEGSRHVIRRGLDQQYAENREETQVPKGRINFGESLRLLAARNNRLVVDYDQLSSDTPPNRVLKSAARALLTVS